MKIIHIQSQQGAALLVSLVILLILTILGISAMSSSSLENRMAQSFQLEHTAFQLAESSLETVLLLADVDAATYDATKDIFDDALADKASKPFKDLTTAVLDPQNHLRESNPTSRTTVEYVAHVPLCPGGSACNKYKVTVAVDIPGTSVSTTHIQYVQIPVASLGP